MATSKIRLYAELVKFEHTLFALPFALSTMLLATTLMNQVWPDPLTVLWILAAMVGGRTYAMGLNRVLDAEIDARNPRTQNRPIPAGLVKMGEAWAITLISAALLVVATFQLPVLCVQLLPIAFVLLTLYSFMKRFSNLSHFVLGLSLGASAIGGWIAVTDSLNSGLPIVFGLAIAFWVAGFDVIYACQDEAFDRDARLHSLAVTYGKAGALTLSRWFHGLTVLLLAGFGAWYQLATGQLIWGFWLALTITLGMLIYEHRLVSPKNPEDLSRVNEAFFNVNGQISLLFFGLILLQRLVSQWG